MDSAILHTSDDDMFQTDFKEGLGWAVLMHGVFLVYLTFKFVLILSSKLASAQALEGRA